MQIISIGPSRHPPKVYLKFNNGSYIPFKLDDVVVLGLKKFTELDEEILQNIYHVSLSFLLLEYSLRQLAISPKTEKVLFPKLRQKLLFLVQKYSYPRRDYSSLVPEIITYLLRNQLLNQLDYQKYIINKSKYKSKIETLFLLKSRGVNISSVDLPSDLPKIRYLLQKKIKNIDISDHKSKQKLISALVRKGFALNEVKTVIDDLTNI